MGRSGYKTVWNLQKYGHFKQNIGFFTIDWRPSIYLVGYSSRVGGTRIINLWENVNVIWPEDKRLYAQTKYIKGSYIYVFFFWHRFIWVYHTIIITVTQSFNWCNDFYFIPQRIRITNSMVEWFSLDQIRNISAWEKMMASKTVKHFYCCVPTYRYMRKCIKTSLWFYKNDHAKSF